MLFVFPIPLEYDPAAFIMRSLQSGTDFYGFIAMRRSFREEGVGSEREGGREGTEVSTYDSRRKYVSGMFCTGDEEQALLIGTTNTGDHS